MKSYLQDGMDSTHHKHQPQKNSQIDISWYFFLEGVMVKGGQSEQEPLAIESENPFCVNTQEIFGCHLEVISTMKSCRELKVLTTHESLPLSDNNVRNLPRILINTTRFFHNNHLIDGIKWNSHTNQVILSNRGLDKIPIWTGFYLLFAFRKNLL